MRGFLVVCAVGLAASEESSLLQVEVDSQQESAFAIQNIGQQIAKLHIPGRADQLAINAMMKTLAKSNKLDDDANRTLQNISDMLEDPILVSLRNEKALKDTELSTVESDVEFCNTEGVTEDTTTFNAIQPKREAHITCREEEFDMEANMSDWCGQAENYVTTAQTELPALCSFDGFASTAPYNNDLVTDMSEYMTKLEALETKFDYYEETVVPVLEVCAELDEDLTSKQTACGQKQNSLQTAICAAYISRNLLCDNREECHANATADHNSRWAAISPVSETRAREACLIKHVICLIDNLVENGNTDINACDDVGLDATLCAANYSNVEPAVPPMETCSRLTHHTGNPTFSVDEYGQPADWLALERAPVDAVVVQACASS